jgi:hypothetical protein
MYLYHHKIAKILSGHHHPQHIGWVIVTTVIYSKVDKIRQKYFPSTRTYRITVFITWNYLMPMPTS